MPFRPSVALRPIPLLGALLAFGCGEGALRTSGAVSPVDAALERAPERVSQPAPAPNTTHPGKAHQAADELADGGSTLDEGTSTDPDAEPAAMDAGPTVDDAVAIDATPPPEPDAAPLPARPRGFLRPMPDTNDRIHVFYDQLDAHLSDAQVAFVAAHADGTQKMTRNITDRIRARAPAFLVLQYRLAFGLSDQANIVDENLWGADTLDPNDSAAAGDGRRADERFYLHAGPDQTRVLHTDGYFLADPRNAEWSRWEIDTLLSRMPTNDFDGAFLDTAHLRFDGFTPWDWFTDFCSPTLERLGNCWNPPTADHFRALTARFHAGERSYYAIGNFGPLVNEWDLNDALGELDGGAIEKFMYLDGVPNERDWHITAERLTRLIGDDKVLLAEPTDFPGDDPQVRRWLMANFLLFRGHKSFVSFYPSGAGMVDAPVWLPEFELDLGAPTTPVPAAIGRLCTANVEPGTCGGTYMRVFARGVVVVNPGDTPRHQNLPPLVAGLRYAEAQGSGGGLVDANGHKAAQRLDFIPLDGLAVDLGPHDARVLVRIGEDGQPVR